MFKGYFEIKRLSCAEELWPFSGSPGAPVKTSTLLIVPTVLQLLRDSPVMTRKLGRGTHMKESERDMIYSYTGEERRQRVGPTGIRVCVCVPIHFIN